MIEIKITNAEDLHDDHIEMIYNFLKDMRCERNKPQVINENIVPELKETEVREFKEMSAQEAKEESEPQVELDSDGQEWNPALHSSSKTKTKNGQWRKLKNKTKDAVVIPPPPPVREYTPAKIQGLDLYKAAKLIKELENLTPLTQDRITEIAITEIGAKTLTEALQNPTMAFNLIDYLQTETGVNVL